MNKILAFSITISLLGIQEISSQSYLNYYETINRAEIANLDKDFKKSDSLYQVAFGLAEKPFKEDFLLASINSEMLNDYQKTFGYLKKGINNGLTLKRIKKQLTEFKKSKEWKKLKKEYNSIRENHLKFLNITLREDIIEMIEADQRVNKNRLAGPRKLKEINKINFDKLLSIIQVNNDKWPGFSTIGEITPKGKYDVTKNISLMLLHFSKEQIEKLKPYIHKAVLNGEMYPYHFARIIDYNNILDCQIYGTYKYNEKYDVGEICDCKKADDERKKIGFETVKDFYRKLESEYKCRTEK